MPANLTIRADGSPVLAYAASGGVPWHKAGVGIENTRDTDAFFAASGLAEVNTEKVEIAIYRMVNGTPRFDRKPVANFRAIMRTETGEVFNVLTNDYGILSARDFIDTLEPVVAEAGGEWESMLSTYGGREMACSIKLPQEMRVGDERLSCYLFGHTRNDGFGKAQIFDTNVRPICSNTVAMALGSKNSAKFSLDIVHREGNVRSKLLEAKSIIRNTLSAYARLEEVANKLLGFKIDDSILLPLEAFLFPSVPEKADQPIFVSPSGADMTIAPVTKEPVMVRRRNEAVEFFRGAYDAEKELNGANGWSAYNAATGYANFGVRYQQSKNSIQDRRLNSIMFGRGAEVSSKAMSFLCDAAGIKL